MTDCKRCGACCSHLIISMLVPSKADIEFYGARGFTVDGNIATADVPHRCPHLDNNNLCDIHDHKPDLCVRFPSYVKDKSTLPVSCVWYELKEDDE